ncbi:hypothetical protein GCM10007880_12050 [Mesorhizobium amorphae]|nr:hypothetical protein GCM10007880_12050 [Mesorhizobium amorphae]
MALALDGQVFEVAKVSQAEFAGASRQLDGKAHARVKVVGHGMLNLAEGCLPLADGRYQQKR